jgi:hypothetical protein
MSQPQILFFGQGGQFQGPGAFGQLSLLGM